MPSRRLIGQNYTTPDLVAKVTGRARYAEDYRAEGMLFCKLLLSPMPHCRVRRLDTSRAAAMAGVKAILTADDMPKPAAPAEGALPPEVALTNEPVYQGEPILAVAAVDEWTAAEAIDAIAIDFEPLPFVVDPIASLRPGGPNARLQGNAFVDGKLATVKWEAAAFAAAADGALPVGTDGTRWAYGDVDAGFAAAALVLDETFHTNATGHEPLETRSAMAYWQNGKLYLHGSTQSVAQTVESVARWTGVDASQVVIVSEYTGGGFGSKIPGAHSMAIPALLAKKAGAPVMMRVTPRRGALHRPHPAEPPRPGQGRLAQGRPDHGHRSVRGPGRRPVRGPVRPRLGARHLLARLPAAGDALPRPLGADQQPAAHVAAVARAACSRTPSSSRCWPRRRDSSASTRSSCTGSTRRRARRRSARPARRASAAT